MEEKIIVYTDGGSRGNPGPAGAGIVITNATGDILKQKNLYLGVLTNNEAEYQAVIFGLETLKRFLGGVKTRKAAVIVRLDSELVARQLRGGTTLTMSYSLDGTTFVTHITDPIASFVGNPTKAFWFLDALNSKAAGASLWSWTAATP